MMLQGNGKLRILYAEDNKAIRRYIHNYLESIGYQVDIAITGGEVWAKYLANTYDIILLDGAMPEATGWEIAKRIRALEKQNKLSRVPLLLLSAFPYEMVHQECLTADIDEFLIKPPEFDDLCAMLDRWGASI